MNNVEKVRENRVRRAAKRQGFELKKSRARYIYPLNIYDYGGYMIVNDQNSIIAGENYRLSLEDTEAFLKVNQKI